MGSSCDSSIYAVDTTVHEMPAEFEILSNPHHTTHKQDMLQMEDHSPNGRKRKSGEPIECCTEKNKFEAPKIVSGECIELQGIESSLKTAVESLQQYKQRVLDFQSIKDQLVESKAEIKWYREKYDLLKELQKQLPETIQLLTQEKQKIFKEKDEIADSLKNAQKEVEQKSDQLKELQTQFVGLKAELQHLAEEKDRIQKVLEEARELLQRKERAYHTFIDTDDSLNCSVCMEPWTQSGEHNI
ncbi:hypothetical protein KI387_013767, partial [Taxus chinensis]